MTVTNINVFQQSRKRKEGGKKFMAYRLSLAIKELEDNKNHPRWNYYYSAMSALCNEAHKEAYEDWRGAL
jgi:hypothetical protein